MYHQSATVTLIVLTVANVCHENRTSILNTDTGLSDSLNLSGIDLPTFIFLCNRRESVCSGLLPFNKQRPPSLQVCQFNHEFDVLSEDSVELRGQQKSHAFPSFSYYSKGVAA